MIAAVVLISGALFYVGCIHRVREVTERDGWLLDWTYKPFQCPHCWGEIERLEFEGQPLACPNPGGLDEELVRFGIDSPVAKLECRGSEGRWRMMFTEDRRPVNQCEEITDEELSRGYYELTSAVTPCKKEGTPVGWCYAVSDNHVRWVDPRRIDELSW
jgi:hypothetical protein